MRRRTSTSEQSKTRQRYPGSTPKRKRQSQPKADVISLREKVKKLDRKKTRQAIEKGIRPKPVKRAIKKDLLWHPKKRARLLALILLLPFAAATIRLIDIQVLRADEYKSMGVAQRLVVREVSPDRGTITDRNGNILAVSQPAYSVTADPSIVEDVDELLDNLHDVIVFNDEDIEDRLRNKESKYAMVLRHIDEPTAKRVREANLPGISVVRDDKREYPGRDIAPNVIGFVNYDMQGSGGLELMVNEALAGEKGEEIIERDPQGREISSSRQDVKKAQRGQDVVMTIDQSIQYEVQRVVLEEVAATNSKGGTAIVADVKTGEILAMVSVVGGPNNPQLASPKDRNFAVTDVYEPGSTNKVITIAGALEEKIISPTTPFTVEDTIYFDDKPFRDHDPHEPMVWNAGDILRESSNVGTIKISNKLKKRNLDRYLRSFGFGSKTALGFPGEAPGILLDPDDYSDTSIATVPVGNGLAVTPLQMLSVYMTIANDGVKVEPKLIKSFISSDGKVNDVGLGETERVISQTTAKQLQSMLASVVQEGTGKKAVVSGYSVAGKTGTARKPPYNKPPYKYIASFAGFAPANNPRLATIVVLDEPVGNYYGGTIAAPIFSRVMQSSLRVMGIQPDQPVQGASISNVASTPTTTAPKQ